MISVWPRLRRVAPAVSVPMACSVIEKSAPSLTAPEPLCEKLSAARSAVEVKVSISVPGVSVAMSAPCALAGSLYQFIVRVESMAFCHVPDPAVANCVTGPMKLLLPIVTVTGIEAAVVLMTLNEEVLRMSLAALLVDVWMLPLTVTLLMV